MSSAKVAVVVVTYNRAALLREAIDAILAQSFHDVVVVDNCSTDETPELLAAYDDPRLQVVRADHNGGGAGGFHIGCAVSADLDVDWVVLQDDDARPAPDFMERLTDAVAGLPDEVGGLAAAVRSPDGAIVEMNRPSVSPFRNRRDILSAVLHGRPALHIEDSAYEADDDTDVDCVAFVGYVMRRELIGGELGLPRKEFFIYADDQSYSYKVRELGYRNVFKPELKYIHDCATYDNTRAVSPRWKVYYLYRNSLEFYRQIAGRFFYPVVPFKLVAWTVRAQRYPRGERVAYLKIAGRGVLDGLRRRFDVPHDDVVDFSS